MLELAGALAERDFAVDLVLCERAGGYLAEIPSTVRVVTLRPVSRMAGRFMPLRADPSGIGVLLSSVLLAPKVSKRTRFVADLARYLRNVRPDTLLSSMTYTNLQALWARRIAGVNVRLVISERTTLSASIREPTRRRAARWRALPPLVRRYYPWADSIVAVSGGVARDLSTLATLPLSRVQAIYNPVVSHRLLQMAEAPVRWPWPADDQPVIMSAGRLEPVKDFPTLLRAFAMVRRQRHAKLIIMGRGSSEGALRRLARELGLEADFALAGWIDNPFAYMAKASLFVLSSRYEGLPGALIQALACGCPSIATDCPNGPREILDHGRYGTLVPPGDVEAIAAAMNDMLDNPPDRRALVRRGLEFSVDRATDQYLDVLLPDYRTSANRPYDDRWLGPASGAIVPASEAPA
jgi:glycosyltransferase involved in cell wall biosynthesis